MAEQWYAVYRIADGELVSVGTVVGALAADLASVALTGQPDMSAQRWDPVGRAFGAIPALTDDDRLLAIPIPVTATLAPTAAAGRAALLEFMKTRILEAQAFDWFNTKAQADGTLNAAQKTAVATLNTQLYQRARSAVASWYAAT